MLYGEGIYVGYRYYDVKDIEPLFPFGFGLSYSLFEYRDLSMPEEAACGETVEVSLSVRNVGARQGREVVQLYVGDCESSLPRPPKELKGFSKLDLKPGETRTARFILDSRAFSFYDPYHKEWIVEPGVFQIMVGSSSRDIRSSKVIRFVGPAHGQP